MDKLRALFGKGDRPATPEPLPDRAPNVTSEQREVPLHYSLIPERVLIHTTLGDITVGLFREQAPKTCHNFATLAATQYYDNVPIHRVIRNFMIQTGDPTGTGRGGSSIYGARFGDEIVPQLTHSAAGVLSMANAGPDTNGSQFFITLAATRHLDGAHTVFGTVVNGMDVVERLGSVKTGRADRPVEEVFITSCEVLSSRS
ncbi:hypothetical protein Q7P37_011293 [Cladosporium fusiforme]